MAIRPEDLRDPIGRAGGGAGGLFGDVDRFQEPVQQERRRREPTGPGIATGIWEPSPSNLKGMSPEAMLSWIEAGPKFIFESVESALNNILSAPPEDLTRYQQQLYVGGFFSEPFEDIRWGFVGPETIEATQRFFQFAAGETARGKPKLWWELLDEVTDVSGGLESFGPEEEEPVEEPVYQVQLTNPQALGAVIDQTFKALVGRRATDAEKRAFVALFHRQEREYQLDFQRMAWEAQSMEPGSLQDDLPTELNPQVEAEEFVDTHAADEADIKSTMDAYGIITDII